MYWNVWRMWNLNWHQHSALRTLHSQWVSHSTLSVAYISRQIHYFLRICTKKCEILASFPPHMKRMKHTHESYKPHIHLTDLSAYVDFSCIAKLIVWFFNIKIFLNPHSSFSGIHFERVQCVFTLQIMIYMGSDRNKWEKSFSHSHHQKSDTLLCRMEHAANVSLPSHSIVLHFNVFDWNS